MAFEAHYAAAEPARATVDAMPLVLIEFGAPWCGHCVAAQPGLQAMLGAQAAVPHLKIEDGPGRPLGRSFRVKLWPTLVLLQAGQEVARAVRPRAPEDLAPIARALQAAVGP